MKKRILKLGTRRSLLAWAQSSWVARQVEQLDPHLQVELVGIETRGDQIQDVPLQKVEGKDFFVAELDTALLEGRVDFTVHSLKDLSLQRPKEFVCGAIPKRANSRDVIVFGSEVLEKLAQGKALRIGTSSPRRLENIPPFLMKALPRFSDCPPELQWVEIRGNVNTRLSRLHEPAESPRHLDGVVLALAGLSRLWADGPGRVELKRLLAGMRWMVLPLTENPTAPGQGALAVECRASDHGLQALLQSLHDPETAEQVGGERAILAESGGGCHQQFGATAVRGHDSTWTWVKGVFPGRGQVQELLWRRPNSPHEGGVLVEPWDGSYWRAQEEDSVERIEPLASEVLGEAVFVAHSRAVHGAWIEKLTSLRVWTSGVASWVKLAQKGIWVEGCAEGMGFEALRSTLQDPVLGLPALTGWSVLTHEQATSEWDLMGPQAIASYRIRLKYTDSARSFIRRATHVFWSSGSQINELKGEVSSQVKHACGPGKTAEHLRRLGMVPDVFPSVEEWRKWIRNGDLSSKNGQP